MTSVEAKKDAIREHPILMSGPMVRAILEGQKTQTRRVVKPQPSSRDGEALQRSLNIRPVIFVDGGEKIRCPYGQPGERLWIRESGWEPKIPTDRELKDGADTWPKYEYDADAGARVCADQFKEWGWKRRPSIFMPRWASRITLEITAVRVERVQEITEKDAKAEGYPIFPDTSTLTEAGMRLMSPRLWFSGRWDELNRKRGFGWEKNPWVWVIEFKKVAPGPITNNE